MSEDGKLQLGQLLSVYPPFIAEESANGVSLKAISIFDRIGFLADFARQIAGIPEGTKIEIKVVNVPDGEI